MQNRILNEHPLLDEQGRLFETGWSDKELLSYNPRCIKFNRMNMKEWDSYIIFSGNGDYALSLILADNRFTGLLGAVFYDLKGKTYYECYAPKILPAGKITLSKSIVNGSTVFKDTTTEIMFLVTDTERHIYFKSSPFIGDSIEANINLAFDKNAPLFSSVSDLDDFQFCYNQKIVDMPASGYVKVNGVNYIFSPENDFAVLDWGRSLRTHDNLRYWCTGAGESDGKSIGINLGYGLLNGDIVTENCVFYNSLCHKLGRIYFDIPEDRNAVWKVRSDDKKFEASIEPICDFENNHKNRVEKSMFGKMNAEITLDDGVKISVNDIICFCERTKNKY